MNLPSWMISDDNKTWKEFKIEDYPDYFGFVYSITNWDNGKFYIGRKQLYSKRTLPPLKNRKNKRHKWVESNWKIYTGSCNELNKDIKNGAKISRQILNLCCSKSTLAYMELYHQVINHVLLNQKSYNDNIQVRIKGSNLPMDLIKDIEVPK